MKLNTTENQIQIKIGLSTKMEFAIAIYHNLNKQIHRTLNNNSNNNKNGNDNNSLLTTNFKHQIQIQNEFIHGNICMQNSFALLFRCSFRGWLVIDNNIKFPYRLVRCWLASWDSRVGRKVKLFRYQKKEKKNLLKMNRKELSSIK